MEAQLSAEFFAGNREKLRTLFTGKAPIVITANGLLQRSGDTTYPFRQDSNFFYLTGINEPDIVLVMDKNKEYLILPPRDPIQDVFDGSIDQENLINISGIETVLSHKEGWKQFSSRLKRVKHIATIAPAPRYIARHGFYTNPARAALKRQFRQIVPSAEILDLRQHLARMRMVKQPQELVALKQAIKITQDTLKKISKKIDSYEYEYEIETDINGQFRKMGADGHGYEPIVAGGINACTLHYVNNRSPLSPKELILIDVGAMVGNYTADITRTLAITTPTKRQKQCYNAVVEAQQFALSLLKPGITLREYELQVEHFMGEKLRELLLIKNVDKASIRKYYPHSTSHFLGLDAHDAGDYEKPLEPNVVLTVEPGIYVPEENTGIRLEDDVVITAEGNQPLGSLDHRLW